MKFEKGVHCWNGPDRSATVSISLIHPNMSDRKPHPIPVVFELNFYKQSPFFMNVGSWFLDS